MDSPGLRQYTNSMPCAAQRSTSSVSRCRSSPVVRLAPGASHERVVLGRVDERVHPVRGKELDELEPLLASPRVAVEPFDDATDGEWRGGAVSDHRPLPCDWYRAFAASPPSTLLLV